MDNVMAILLAAGMGKRMGKLTTDLPKSLLKIGEKKLIEYAIDFVKFVGFKDIVVVGGYQFSKLKSAVENYDTAIRVIENTEFDKQNLVSFKVGASGQTDKDILVCNTDYIFSKDIAKRVAEGLRGISVFCSYDLSADDVDVMKVKTKNGQLLEMSKQLDNYDAIYTGIFFIDYGHLPLVNRLVDEILANQDPYTVTVERLFKELIDAGETVNVQDVGKAEWIEVDTPEEFSAALSSLQRINTMR
jgi:CDP-L-myo-inositol myo-inositolphosphotransferase